MQKTIGIPVPISASVVEPPSLVWAYSFVCASFCRAIFWGTTSKYEQKPNLDDANLSSVLKYLVFIVSKASINTSFAVSEGFNK